MAIHIDIFARVNDRQVEAETRKLADSFDQTGTTSADLFTDKLTARLAANNPKVQKAMTALAAASTAAWSKNTDYNKALEQSALLARDLEGATDKVTAARNREANASAKITEAEYNLNRYMATSKRDLEVVEILTERVATAKRNHANASQSVTAATLAESKAHINHFSTIDSLTNKYNALSIANRRYGDASRAMANEIRTAGEEAKRSGSALEELKRTLVSPTRALVSLAGPELIAALVETAQVAITASQALLLLPAAATAAGAGMLTLKLATDGFGQAMKDIGDIKKFNADLAALSPNAQQAAMSIKTILPELDHLKNATQDAFFAGFDQKIQQLSNTFLPTVQGLTTGIATSVNQAIIGVADMLSSPGGKSDVAAIAANIGEAFKAAAPAVQSFSQAFLEITKVGSDFLPSLGEGIAGAAREFASFIHEAAQSGQLKDWIQQGLNAAKALGGVIQDVGKRIYEVFGGASQSEIDAWRTNVTDSLDIIQGILTTLVATLDVLNTKIPVVGKTFLEWVNPLLIIRDVVNSIRWFFDPSYQAGNNAISAATQKLNDARAKIGQPPVDDKGNVVGPGSNYSLPGGGSADQNFNGLLAALTRLPGQGAVAGRGLSAFLGQNENSSGWGPGGGIFSDPTKKLPKDKAGKYSAPSDQWSLTNIPIGSFPGVGGPAIPPLPGMPGGPPLQQLGPVNQLEAFNAQSALITAGHNVEEARQEYLKLAHDNTTTETELLKAKNNIAETERSYISKQMELNKTLQGKYEGLASGLGEIGAALDKDLGISKGLPGIADNLVRFLASLAAAPLMGQMAAQVANDPHKGGYGLMGILSAQGVFGPAFTGLDTDQSGKQSAYTSGIPGAADAAVQNVAGVPGAVLPTLPGLSGNGAGGGDGGLNLSTIPVAAQKYANDCIDASARIILSHAGVNKTEDELKNIITPGGSIDSLAAGLNQLNPQGNFRAMQGSGGSPQAMFGAIKASIDKGTGSILNVAPGSSLAGHTFAPGHFIAATGYNPDGTINVSDTAGGRKYSVSQADAFQATRGRGIVAGTGTGPAPLGGTPLPVPLPVTITGGIPGTPGAGQPGGGPAAGSGGLNWDALAAKESGGNWANKSNSKYMGGLQFDQGTWNAYRGAGTPPNAADATKEQQIAAGQAALAAGRTPQSLWPTNYGQLGLPPTIPGAGSSGLGFGPINRGPQGGVAVGPMAGGGAGWTYNSDRPTGGGNFNPGVQIDTGNISTPNRGESVGPHGVPYGGAYGPYGPDDWDGRLGPTQRGSSQGPDGRWSQRGFVGGGRPQGPQDQQGPGLPDVSGDAWMNNRAGIPLGAPLAQGPGPYQPNIGPGPLQPGSPYIGAPNWNDTGGPGSPAPGGIGPFGVPPAVSNTQGMPGASAVTPLGPPGGPGASGWAPQTKIGGLAPPGSISPGSGIGMTPGGTLDTAISLAASGLDLIAPGAGQAAQTGIKLANRAIQYGGQLAGIGVQGLMETFLPTGGSELANNGWAPRLVGAIAGAAPALPNIAGGKGGAPQAPPPLTPEQALASGNGTGPPPGPPNVDITVNNNNASPDQNGRIVAHHATQAATLPGAPVKPGQ